MNINDLKELLKKSDWISKNQAAFLSNKNLLDFVFNSEINIKELTDSEFEAYLNFKLLHTNDLSNILENDHELLKEKLDNIGFFKSFNKKSTNSVNMNLVKAFKNQSKKMFLYLTIHNVKETMSLTKRIDFLEEYAETLFNEAKLLMPLLLDESEINDYELSLDLILRLECSKIEKLKNEYPELVEKSLRLHQDKLIENFQVTEYLLDNYYPCFNQRNYEIYLCKKLKFLIDNFNNEEEHRSLFSHFLNLYLEHRDEDGMSALSSLLNKEHSDLKLKKKMRFLSFYEIVEFSLILSLEDLVEIYYIAYKIGFEMPETVNYHLLKKLHNKYSRKELLFKMLNIDQNSILNLNKEERDKVFYFKRYTTAFKNEIFTFFSEKVMVKLMINFSSLIACETLYMKKANKNFDMEKMVDFLCDLLYYTDDNLDFSADVIELLNIKYKI